jgi:hypothetical protein
MARVLGLCSRTGTAVAVVLDGTTLVGRWALDLTEGRVPAQMFHVAHGRSDPQDFIDRAVATVADVTDARIRELAARVDGLVGAGIVVGDHVVPDSVPKVLASHALMHAAEGQLYRDALVDAAQAAGLRVVCVPRTEAQAELERVADAVAALGRAAGTPWRKEHKLAAVAALAAAPAASSH